MSDRRLLYFTANGHRLYLWRSGTLVLEGAFAADDEGVTAFADFAKLHPKSLYYVLADLAGEDFHDEVIPWIRGGDREAIIERRLAQRYRDTRLAATVSLGPVAVAGERRNERLLLASFTNTQQFSPWLDALTDAGAKLAGVYSVPLVAPALAGRLAGKLGAKSSQMFVVSLNSAGLRQSYLEDGKLRFARLERAADLDPDSLAAFVRSETLRLVQYLSSLRVLPRDGPPISAIVIAPAGQREVFERSLPSDQRLMFRTVELPEAARISGVKSAEGMDAEQLYLHLLARRAPKDQFARGDDRKEFKLWQLQRGIAAAGMLALAGCTMYSGYKWFDVIDILEQTELQVREARIADQEYNRITASFPVTQTTTENLKATVNEFRLIASRSSLPDAALVYISKALEEFPQMELDQLVWNVGAPGALPKPAPDPSKPIPATAKEPANPASAPKSVTAMELIEISGHVTSTQKSDYRAITSQVQRFADALRADPSYEIVRTQLPFDTTSEGTLSGDIGATESSDTPRFTIVLARRVAK